MRIDCLAMLASLIVSAAALQAQAAGGTSPPTQPAVPLTQEKPGLLAQARITDAAARGAALARVPGGAIVKAELEQEKGKVIFSYDIAVPGKEGIQEVAVDATTGAVLSVEYESPAEEAKEDSADARKKSP